MVARSGNGYGRIQQKLGTYTSHPPPSHPTPAPPQPHPSTKIQNRLGRAWLPQEQRLATAETEGRTSLAGAPYQVVESGAQVKHSTRDQNSSSFLMRWPHVIPPTTEPHVKPTGKGENRAGASFHITTQAQPRRVDLELTASHSVLGMWLVMCGERSKRRVCRRHASTEEERREALIPPS